MTRIDITDEVVRQLRDVLETGDIEIGRAHV